MARSKKEPIVYGPYDRGPIAEKLKAFAIESAEKAYASGERYHAGSATTYPRKHFGELERRFGVRNAIELQYFMDVYDYALATLGQMKRSRGRVVVALQEPVVPREILMQDRKSARSNPASTMHDFGDGNGPVPAHQHWNPDGSLGGWVADTAFVGKKAFVGPEAQVFGSADVVGRARIEDRAQVYDEAKVKDRARVSGNAKVFGNASVFDSAILDSNVQVYEWAWVFEHAWLTYETKVFGQARVGQYAELRGGMVYGRAHIFGRAQLEDEPQVYGNAMVYDNARIAGQAQIYDRAKVYYHAQVYDQAHVFGDARVHGFAEVGYDERVSGGSVYLEEPM